MENAAELLQKIETLASTLVLKEREIAAKNLHIQLLEEKLAQFRRRQFAAASEKIAPGQLSLFDEPEIADTLVEESANAGNKGDTVEIAAHQRTRRRASIPDSLPRVEIVHDLPEDQKFCPHDGTALKAIGSETHEQLEIIPAKIYVLKHLRKTYACPCCESYLITASKPKQPIEKSIATPSLLATVATQKYADGLPLYRQINMFKRIDVELETSTLANWMQKCGSLAQPLINLIHEKMLGEKCLHMDETKVQVLNEPGKEAQSQSYMWVMRSTESSPAVLFHYEPARSGNVAKELLREFGGALMVDGYEGYNPVCEINGITRLGCWTHARRKFYEAQKAQPKGKTGKADEALNLIQKLYRVEQRAKDTNSDEKYQLRQQESKPILDKLKAWMDKSLPQVPPKSALGKAFHYLQTQWPRLIRYVENGDYPIDNNPAENAIRPFVIGRKNWLFSTSQKGARASANLYSLIETAKANGLEPFAYLKHIFTALPNAQTLEDIEALLPWNVKSGV